jgi:2-polyprenyl-6-methoxyphenol hydroxylase-like FAD-dependent oxidoreductase
VIDKDEREQRMTSWDLLYNVLRANFDGGGERSYCAVPEGREGEEGRKGAAEYKTDSIVTDIREVDSKKLQIHYRSHAEPDSTKKTQPADLVIAADGASSTIRNLYVPVERKYAGYVAWRGTVPESVILREYPAAAEAFIEKFSFFHADGLQILSYVIPGPNGTVKPGERLVNYVWYCNYPENSEEWRDLMTDTSGKLNSTTLHAGKMRSEVWETQKSYARDVLPPQFADLVCATTEPFVQAISDSILPEDTDNVFAGGRVVCVGDAVAGLRPHTAASTTQAARNALGLESVMKGEMEWKDWQEQTMRWAHETQKGGVTMGER